MSEPMARLDSIATAPPRSVKSRAASIATRVITANRNTTMQSTATILLVLVGFFISSVAIIATRPLHISNSENLVDTGGRVVNTGKALGTWRLVNLPALGDFIEYGKLESITYYTQEGASSEQLSSWTWVDSTRMVLRTREGSVALIDNGHLRVLPAPPSGLVRFDGTGATVRVGSARNASSLMLDSVRAICVAAECAPTMCSATTVAAALSGTLEVRDVKCEGGVQLWAWPSDRTLQAPASRRALDDCPEHILDAVNWFDERSDCDRGGWSSSVTVYMDNNDACRQYYLDACSTGTGQGGGGSGCSGHHQRRSRNLVEKPSAEFSSYARRLGFVGTAPGTC